MMDKLIHPHYTEDMGWYPDKPYELKHVYDTVEDKYVVNELQCCYYSSRSKHKECKHKGNCIFSDERWECYDEVLSPIVYRIKEIMGIISDYENIKQCLLNDEIIYHETLKDYYIIRKEKIDGEVRVNVSVPSNFKNIINKMIDNLKLELRDLNRELLRVKRGR